jgi:hypothetical protein
MPDAIFAHHRNSSMGIYCGCWEPKRNCPAWNSRLEVLRMSQASFQVFILGGPRPNYPRAFISLAADNSGTIQFWDDGETIPSDSQGTMNLPVSMFAAVLDWLGNEQNPHLYDSGVGFEYLTSSWEATGQGEIVRSPIAPYLARLGKVHKTTIAAKKVKSKKAAV